MNQTRKQGTTLGRMMLAASIGLACLSTAIAPAIAQSGATCDVEPLTVDEVIAIVENPYSTIDDGWWATPSASDETDPAILVQNAELVEAPNIWESGLPYPREDTYTEAEPEPFAEALEAANQMVACIASGTRGQVWALTEPTVIQSGFLWANPVYRTEADIRAAITDLIHKPAEGGDDSYVMGIDFQLEANPNREDARQYVISAPEFLDFDTVMVIGWQGTSTDGTIVFRDNWQAATIEGDNTASNGTSMILVRSQSTGAWYLAGYHAPRG